MPRILYLQYTNPAGYPPLEHSSQILASANWQVLFLGTGALGSNNLRFPSHKNIRMYQMPFSPSGWRLKFHYMLYGLWVIAWVLRWRPDWIYASDSPSAPVAWLLSYSRLVKVIYHEHDSPSSVPSSFFMRMLLAARQKLAQRAEICVLPNQQRADNFAAETASVHKVVCVWNCPAQAEILPPRLSIDESNLGILYHGSVVPARLPLTVLEALAMLPAQVRLRIVGYETMGHLGYTSELKARASQLGIGDRVEFVEALPRYQLLELGKSSDVGLALMPASGGDINVRHMIGASNKAFDYLACGLALLVSDLPDWRRMYVEPGYGSFCNPEDPESLACALKWFLDHRSETRHMGEQGRQKILAEWTYERQFAPVAKLLAESQM